MLLHGILALCEFSFRYSARRLEFRFPFSIETLCSMISYFKFFHSIFKNVCTFVVLMCLAWFDRHALESRRFRILLDNRDWFATTFEFGRSVLLSTIITACFSCRKIFPERRYFFGRDFARPKKYRRIVRSCTILFTRPGKRGCMHAHAERAVIPARFYTVENFCIRVIPCSNRAARMISRVNPSAVPACNPRSGHPLFSPVKRTRGSLRAKRGFIVGNSGQRENNSVPGLSAGGLRSNYKSYHSTWIKPVQLVRNYSTSCYPQRIRHTHAYSRSHIVRTNYEAANLSRETLQPDVSLVSYFFCISTLHSIRT